MRSSFKGMNWRSIVRLDVDKDDRLYSLLTGEIGDALDEKQALRIIDALSSCKVVTPREARLMKAAVRDKSIPAPASMRDVMRAQCLKSQILELLNMQKEGKA